MIKILEDLQFYPDFSLLEDGSLTFRGRLYIPDDSTIKRELLDEALITFCRNPKHKCNILIGVRILVELHLFGKSFIDYYVMLLMIYNYIKVGLLFLRPLIYIMGPNFLFKREVNTYLVGGLC